MSTQNEPKTREEIQRAFSPLLRSHQAKASQIATKAEEAELAKDREIAERATAYTVESIVNDLAKLQLEFGTSVEAIAQQLSAESGKVGELERAIQVEERRLAGLENTILAAEALAILTQDHAQKLASFEERAADKRRDLDEDIADTRAAWQKEAEEHAAALKEYQANQEKDRNQALADHAYDRGRQQKVQEDKNSDKRRDLERKLADEEADKARDWSAREKVLSENEDKIAELRTKVDGFPAELEKKIKAARERAIATVQREAKFDSEMAEKDHAANTQVSELKIETLEARIKAQAEQIADLSAKLDATIAKSQNLAEQAFKPARGE